MRNYWSETQKGKVIRIMLIKWANKYYEDFELESLKRVFKSDIFVWNNSWARLSQLLKDWVLDVEYFKNPAINPLTWCHCYKRARYKLKDEFIPYYKKLYEDSL